MGGIENFIRNKEEYNKDIEVNLGVIKNVLESRILKSFRENPLLIHSICYSLHITETLLDHILDDENQNSNIELLLKIILALGYKVNISIEEKIND